MKSSFSVLPWTSLSMISSFVLLTIYHTTSKRVSPIFDDLHSAHTLNRPELPAPGALQDRGFAFLLPVDSLYFRWIFVSAAETIVPGVIGSYAYQSLSHVFSRFLS